MAINYKQLEALVKEAMFTPMGGINEPSAPPDIPLRQPAADPPKEDFPANAETDAIYDVALEAREATERLVEKLDEPIYDGAYEHAFKASSNLRRALNALEEVGATPTPQQRVVAPPRNQQPYSGYVPYTPFANLGLYEAEGEEEDVLRGMGSKTLSRTAHSAATKARGAGIGSGDVLGGVDNRERAMLQSIEQVLTDIADKDDLLAYKAWFQTVLKSLLKKVEVKLQNQGVETNETEPTTT